MVREVRNLNYLKILKNRSEFEHTKKCKEDVVLKFINTFFTYYILNYEN